MRTMLLITDHKEHIEVPVRESLFLHLDGLHRGPLDLATSLAIKVGIEPRFEKVRRIVCTVLVSRQIEAVKTRCELDRFAQTTDEVVRDGSCAEDRPHIVLERD